MPNSRHMVRTKHVQPCVLVAGKDKQMNYRYNISMSFRVA